MIPLRRGIYAAEISNLYVQLANTFNNETIAQIVPFTKDEIKSYKELMKEAILDAASQKKTGCRHQGSRTDLQTGHRDCREAGGVTL